MPSCEKCWSDSATIEDHAGAYHKLLERRDREGKTCTPEEQAGPDATECPECHRMTCHQWCHVCMACGYDPKPATLRTGEEP